MLGTLVNVGAIIAGSIAGLIFKGNIPEQYKKTILQAVSLGVIYVGLKSAFDCEDFILIILSLAVGSLAGELFKIEQRLNTLGAKLEKKFSC